MADKDFVVKNGLVVNTSFSANSTQFTLATINATSNGFFANTSQIKIGNSSVNATINSTAFTGDAATVGSNTASTLRTYSDTVGSTAYSNAMSNTLSRNGSYTGNNTFGGTNTVISSNLNVTGTFINVASAFIANSTGAYHTGIVNAANFITTGTVNTATVYATGVVNAANFTTTGTVNTSTVYATGLVNAANFTTTGTVNTGTVYATGLVNAANFTTTGTVNTATVYATGLVNAANFTTTGTVNTGTVYATGLVNAANFTTTGTVNTATVYATGLVNAVSYNTGGGYGSATGGAIVNTTTIAVGNSSVNVSTNSTVFSGTSNNSTYLNGQLASYYNNATNLNAGTVASARISGSYTGITGVGTITAGTWQGSSISTTYTDAKVSSVSGSGGLTGTVTSSGSISVLANNGITANSSGTFVTQGTGAVVNATGVHVNSTYIGTISANNASYLGGVAAASYAQLSGATFTGDITTYRSASPTTGVIYLGNGNNRYLYYNGTVYDMPGANLYINSGLAWTSGNDGAGSGLDADTLDGLQGSSYANTSAPQITSLGVGTAASGTSGEIRATDNITAYYSSDARLKTNVVEISNALEKVNQIRGVEFDWTDEFIEKSGGEDGYFTRKHDVGVIAQEIEKVLPEVVAERDNGIKAVKYDRIVALLIEAVKDLSKQVKELKGNR